MSDFVSTLAGLLLKTGVIALLINEVRGFILAAPVLYTLYRAGGAGQSGIGQVGSLTDQLLLHETRVMPLEFEAKHNRQRDQHDIQNYALPMFHFTGALSKAYPAAQTKNYSCRSNP